jgi:Dolichyl-phosphate-mannose-protein mannosyltransferase
MLRAPFVEVSRVRRLVAPVLLAIVFAVPVLIMREKSATFDEVAHLPAGYSYLVRHSILYNLQHPPLIKEICAIPLLFMKVDLPPGPHLNEWDFGKDFLFRQNAHQLLFWGRVPAVALSLALAFVVLQWATTLWGKSGGFLALFLYAFDPTITAHAQLITTDIGLALFSTVYLWRLRAYLHQPSARNALLSGLTLGLALGAKFSAVVLIPVSLMLMGAAAIWSPESEGQPSNGRGGLAKRRLVLHGVAFAGMMLLAAAVLWTLYFFPKDPSAYWKGIQLVNQDRGSSPYFYLMGELRPGGWDSYFLIAWLVKTPIPALVLLGAGLVMLASGRRARWLDEAFLLVPAVSYFIFYSVFADNIGVRYLIPCFPFLFIFAGRLAQIVERARPLRSLLLGTLLVWSLVEYMTIMPDHLSYFNQVAGGAEGGVEWLDHSNLDWGQGLMQLQKFIQENAIEDYAYFYFGTADPGYYGIKGRRITDFEFLLRPTRGLVILSVHFIPRGRDVLDRVFGRGPLNWLRHQNPIQIVGHAFYVYEIR